MKSCNKLLIITDWKPLVLMLHVNSKTLAKVRERNIFNQKTQCYLCASPLGQNAMLITETCQWSQHEGLLAIRAVN